MTMQASPIRVASHPTTNRPGADRPSMVKIEAPGREVPGRGAPGRAVSRVGRRYGGRRRDQDGGDGRRYLGAGR